MGSSTATVLVLEVRAASARHACGLWLVNCSLTVCKVVLGPREETRTKLLLLQPPNW